VVSSGALGGLVIGVATPRGDGLSLAQYETVMPKPSVPRALSMPRYPGTCAARVSIS
jgi:hypothetical protein